MSKSNKIITAVCSVICFVACVVTLVFYFAYKPKSSFYDNPIELNDIYIFKDDLAPIQFTLHEKDAIVSFSVTDESIANIVDNNLVEGVSEGATFLNAVVMTKKGKVSRMAQIIVAQKQSDAPMPDITPDQEHDNKPTISHIYCKVDCKKNCAFYDDKLHVMKGEKAYFSVSLYEDEEFSSLIAGEIELIGSAGVKVERDFNYFWVLTDVEGAIFVSCADINHVIGFEVVFD